MGKSGMNHAPKGEHRPVCAKGEFPFAAIGLDHGHIYGMCNGLVEAGGELASVYDPDPAKVEQFVATYPQAKPASCEEEILESNTIKLVAGAAVPADRSALGLRVMEHGKDYFTDKPPLTTLAQLAEARAAHERTGRKYAVYYSERLHSESAVYADRLVGEGAIGRVLHVAGFGPHRISIASRPAWFFERERYGGILCDIGSHQVEQFLHFAGAADATVGSSRIANYHHKEYPGLEDFGDATLVADNGATQYFRVDWFTPDGLGTWGDGRTFLLGTDGYIEMRKYVDIARDPGGDHLYLVNREGERHFALAGTVGFPYFGQLILDCLHRTEEAMTQAHAFKAIELSITAQERAARIE